MPGSQDWAQAMLPVWEVGRANPTSRGGAGLDTRSTTSPGIPLGDIAASAGILEADFHLSRADRAAGFVHDFQVIIGPATLKGVQGCCWSCCFL